MLRVFQTAFHVAGTLTADLAFTWTAAFDCTLIGVSAVASDANAFGVTLGDSTDADGYMTKWSSGVSGTPVEKVLRTDFDGALALSQFPHIADGTIIKLAVDYNYNGGGSGAASDDPTIVLTFTEG